MNDTVRDAVFGNVGTMISFRVSADDAPILAKQFEPNFEAVDLLQMHNRNFVINMVIGGEKTPAFSARTLELPPSQADNTLHIIEHSRRTYSRDREEVEQEISSVIMPPRPQKQSTQLSPQTVAATVQNQTMANQPEPTRTTSKPATPQTTTTEREVVLQIRNDSALNQTTQSNRLDATVPKKRRRRRKRSVA